MRTTKGPWFIPQTLQFTTRAKHVSLSDQQDEQALCCCAYVRFMSQSTLLCGGRAIQNVQDNTPDRRPLAMSTHPSQWASYEPLKQGDESLSICGSVSPRPPPCMYSSGSESASSAAPGTITHAMFRRTNGGGITFPTTQVTCIPHYRCRSNNNTSTQRPPNNNKAAHPPPAPARLRLPTILQPLGAAPQARSAGRPIHRATAADQHLL